MKVGEMRSEHMKQEITIPQWTSLQATTLCQLPVKNCWVKAQLSQYRWILSNRSLNHKILANNHLPSTPFGLSWASLSDNILSQSEWLSGSIWLLIWFVNNIYYHHCSILLNTIVSTTSLSCVSLSPVQSYLSLLPYLISILNPSPMSTGPGWSRLEEKTKFYQMDKLDTKSFLSYRKQDYTRSEYYNDFSDVQYSKETSHASLQRIVHSKIFFCCYNIVRLSCLMWIFCQQYLCFQDER